MQEQSNNNTLIPVVPPASPTESPDSQQDQDKKPYNCNICKVACSQGSTLNIHMRTVRHQMRASKLQDLAASGQIDLGRPLIEQPSLSPNNPPMTPEPQQHMQSATQHLSQTTQDILSQPRHKTSCIHNHLLESFGFDLVMHFNENHQREEEEAAAALQAQQENAQKQKQQKQALAAQALQEKEEETEEAHIDDDVIPELTRSTCHHCNKEFSSVWVMKAHYEEVHRDFVPREFLEKYAQQFKCKYEKKNVLVTIATSSLTNTAPRSSTPVAGKPQDLSSDKEKENKENTEDKECISQTPEATRMYNHLLESFGYDIVMQFNENHRRRQRKEEEAAATLQAQQEQQKQEQQKQALPAQALLKKEEETEEAHINDNVIPELTRSTCQNCNKEFSSVWVLKAHREEVHRDFVPREFLEKYAQQFKCEYEKKNVVVTIATSSLTNTAPRSSTPAAGKPQDLNSDKEKEKEENTENNECISQTAEATSTTPATTPALSKIPVSSTDSTTPTALSTNLHHIPKQSQQQQQQKQLQREQQQQQQQQAQISFVQMFKMQAALNAVMAASYLQQQLQQRLMMGLPLGLNVPALAAMNLQPPLVPMMRRSQPYDGATTVYPPINRADLLAKQHLAFQQQQAAAMANAAVSQKRPYTRFTDEQLKILQAHFDINNPPDEKQILEMAGQSGLPSKVIKRWFKNKLLKERRNKDSTYNNSSSTTLNLEEYEKIGEAKANAAVSQKQTRTRITDEQQKILQAHFDINNSPDEEQILEMAGQSGLPFKVIRYWFRNKLFKERQRNKDSPYNFNNPPNTTLNLADYEKICKAKVTPLNLSVFGSSSSNDKFPNKQATPPLSLQNTSASQSIEFKQKALEQSQCQQQLQAAQHQDEQHHSPDSSASGQQSRSHSPTFSISSVFSTIHHDLSSHPPLTMNAPSTPMLPPKLASQNFANPTPGTGGVVPSANATMALTPQRSLSRGRRPTDYFGSNSNGSKTSGGSSGKRHRTRFTDYQIKVLQEFFENNAYLNEEEIEYLSKLLDLSPRVILVWFQNTRQKSKVYKN